MDKPTIDVPNAPAPTDLVIEDIVVGEGDEAQAGGMVKVHYLGFDYQTGEEFDSSWDRGEAAEFPLAGLIEGWQEGIPGMKVGGRRQLTIPPEKAYGPAGGGHPLSGRTLVFIIDLLEAN
ncbi:peptidylprolyl isomerase [Corynebacterium appendicis CIP 107643]|uniref:Peptidyl-prolyl cis-trans isomerase n=1 Tax=Corynebacterium appendicis CIP 107643 TaxID=1161099 RepID=A0A1N7JYB8_9CORY|nr:FKBP-type peptidyl-prolyl cis-trans isomerase [Corynebacterium appendicis]WJY60564.1 FK506-binding protein [Corynebacterium appendicis CIP 107643]SIS54333.1 peptidylprolyl isomerase [Corynebacterium appendicis CIP 107643]